MLRRYRSDPRGLLLGDAKPEIAIDIEALVAAPHACRVDIAAVDVVENAFAMQTGSVDTSRQAASCIYGRQSRHFELVMTQRRGSRPQPPS
jgi:hypothetical protein